MKQKLMSIWLGVTLVFGLSAMVAMLITAKPQPDASLKPATSEEVLRYLEAKPYSFDQAVGGSLKPQIYHDDRNDGDMIREYDDNLYFCNYEKVGAINLARNRKLIHTFTDFYPSHMQVYEDTLVVFGIRCSHQDITITPTESFPYDNYEFEIKFLSRLSLTEYRSIHFPNLYFQGTRLVDNMIYLLLHSSEIINRETNSLILPRWNDTLFGEQMMEEDHLYLSKAGNPVEAMSVLLRFSLDQRNATPLEAMAMVGVEGLSMINNQHLVLASWLYDHRPMMAVHVIELPTFAYMGHLSLEGYILHPNSIATYGGYLRIAISHYEGEAIRNLIYNVELASFRIAAALEIAPGEEIYSIRFRGDYGYLSTYLYVDPFFILDFSLREQIKIVIEKKIDFVNEYIAPGDESILTIGRMINQEGFSSALVIAELARDTLMVNKQLVYDCPNIDTEIRYNEKVLYRDERYLMLPFYQEDHQSLMILEWQEAIVLKQIIPYPDDYISRCTIIDGVIYAMAMEKIYLYQLKDFQLIGTSSL